MTANATHWFFTPLQELLTRSQRLKNENRKNAKNPLLPTPALTDPYERPEMYACGKCKFTGRREACEKHFLIKHMDEEHVPWMCSLCGFRCRTERALDSHMIWDIHKRALVRKPDEHTSFVKAKDPHEIEIGKDIFLSTEDRPYYFSRGNRYKSKNTHKPLYTSGEYDDADDIRYDDSRQSRKRSRKRKETNSFDYSNGFDGNDWNHSRDDYETEDFPIEANNSVLIDDSNLEVVHSTTNVGAEQQAFDCLDHQTNLPTDLLGKLIDEMHSTDSNIGLTSRRHRECFNQRQETENKPKSRPRTPQSSPRETFAETASRNSVFSITSTPNKILPADDHNLSEPGVEINNASDHLHDLDENVDPDIDEDYDTDDENLGDKINEIIHVLEPLKNISKALIAIDHHFRRVFPLLEALIPNVPQTATPTKGQCYMAPGHAPEQSGEFLRQADHGSGHAGESTGQYIHANVQNSGVIGHGPAVMGQGTFITGQAAGQDVGTTGLQGSNNQCSVGLGQGARSLRQGLLGQTEFLPLGQFSTVTGQSFSKRPRINNDPRTRKN